MTGIAGDFMAYCPVARGSGRAARSLLVVEIAMGASDSSVEGLFDSSPGATELGASLLGLSVWPSPPVGMCALVFSFDAGAADSFLPQAETVKVASVKGQRAWEMVFFMECPWFE